jgi:uncharacterized damage-inducible protein DinB
MNTEDFRTLYEYNAWANNRILDACEALSPEQFLRELGSSFSSVRDTLAHMSGAEWIWYERWHGRAPQGMPKATDYADLKSLRTHWADIGRDLFDYVASLNEDDLVHVMQFKTMAGTAIAQPLWQCLQHVANHSTYHRGQITTMLRQLGAKPAGTDMIGFYRERAARETVKA